MLNSFFEKKDSVSYFSPWYYYQYCNKKAENISQQLTQISEQLQDLNLESINYSCYRLEELCFKSSQGILGRAIRLQEVKQKIREDRLRLKAISSLLLALEQSIGRSEDGSLFFETKITSEEELHQFLEQGIRRVEE